MNYLEAMHGGHTVTKSEAMREVAKHGSLWADLVADLGEREEYTSQEILIWLGY